MEVYSIFQPFISPCFNHITLKNRELEVKNEGGREGAN